MQQLALHHFTWPHLATFRLNWIYLSPAWDAVAVHALILTVFVTRGAYLQQKLTWCIFTGMQFQTKMDLWILDGSHTNNKNLDAIGELTAIK